MIIDIVLKIIISIITMISGYIVSRYLSINNTKLFFSREKVNICYKLLLFFIAGIISVTIVSIVTEINYGLFIALALSLLLLYVIAQLDKKFYIIPNVLCLILLLISCINLIFIESIFNNIISLIFIAVLVIILYLLSLKNLVEVAYGDLKLLLSIGLMFNYWFVLPFLFISFLPILFTKKRVPVAPYIFIGYAIVKMLELIIYL